MTPYVYLKASVLLRLFQWKNSTAFFVNCCCTCHWQSI